MPEGQLKLPLVESGTRAGGMAYSLLAGMSGRAGYGFAGRICGAGANPEICGAGFVEDVEALAETALCGASA